MASRRRLIVAKSTGDDDELATTLADKIEQRLPPIDVSAAPESLAAVRPNATAERTVETNGGAGFVLTRVR